MRSPSIIVIMLCLISSPVAQAQDSGRLEPKTFRYATRPGVAAKLTSLDIYGAKPGESRPILIMVHGGGWQSGDKANRAIVHPKAEATLASGAIFISVNYRLSPEIKHPAHVEDLAAAIAWVHDKAPRFGGDASRIALIGHSAGAHLVALVATEPRFLAAHGKGLEILRGVVALDTAAWDIPRLFRDFAKSPRARMLYEQAFGDAASQMDASPSSKIQAGRGFPPFLIFTTGERQDSKTLALAFIEALRGVGGEASFTQARDRTHAGINACIGEKGDPYSREVAAFLKRVWARAPSSRLY